MPVPLVAVPGIRLRLTEPYVTLAYAVGPRLLSITSTALSPAAADWEVGQVAAAGPTPATVVEPTVNASALAFIVKRSKNHPTPSRIEFRNPTATSRQSTGGNHPRRTASLALP